MRAFNILYMQGGRVNGPLRRSWALFMGAAVAGRFDGAVMTGE